MCTCACCECTALLHASHAFLSSFAVLASSACVARHRLCSGRRRSWNDSHVLEALRRVTVAKFHHQLKRKFLVQYSFKLLSFAKLPTTNTQTIPPPHSTRWSYHVWPHLSKFNTQYEPGKFPGRAPIVPGNFSGRLLYGKSHQIVFIYYLESGPHMTQKRHVQVGPVARSHLNTPFSPNIGPT